MPPTLENKYDIVEFQTFFYHNSHSPQFVRTAFFFTVRWVDGRLGLNKKLFHLFYGSLNLW